MEKELIKIMKRFKIFYWKHKNDECIDCERIVEAYSFDIAYQEFRKNNPFVKIREIKEIL